jgi:hypothetical protein
MERCLRFFNHFVCLRGQRPDLFPQNREKKALNVIPGVCLRLAQSHVRILIGKVIRR